MKNFSKKQLKELKNSDSVIERLTVAVIEQGLTPDYFEDVVKHGIDGGFSGFIYYDDTFDFYKKHRKDILALAKQQAEELGESNVIDMIAGFAAFAPFDGKEDYTDEIGEALWGNPEESTSVTNVLAWYAAEQVAMYWADQLENA